ncbi:MAG: hypothetical protein CL484_01995 [Acidobacteria bacterium]|nr:hypothetical protein [Acidobacteriota bacterium]|tara:strand:+ start:2070 stop:2903 length:834 start_codon:yes stop_codon:yes gene_type:complete
MPELPEVEHARQLIEQTAKGYRIIEVGCASDSVVLEGVTAAEIRQALRNRIVCAARRRGKHIWLELDKRPWPCFHLGMTGAFHTANTSPIKLVTSHVVEEKQWPPRFTKLHLTLSNESELVMTNKRRLGRIRLRQDPTGEPPISQLGFDPLLDLPSLEKFSEWLTGRSGAIKSLLLDQSFAAGVGNWIADEVLYQAKISPKRPTHQLSKSEIKIIRLRLRHIIETAVQANADASKFPKTWLFHRRWNKNANSELAGHSIEFITVGGRTTAWVPELQR